jgi:hypothetical protein
LENVEPRFPEVAGAMRVGIRAFLTVTTAALLLPGCGDSTGPIFTHLGEYNLVTINGEELPVVIFQGQSGTTEMVAATIELREGESCHATQTHRLTFQGQSRIDADEEGCTYELDEGTIVIRWDRGGSDTGSLAPSRITLATLGIVMVFER